ncbi:transcriptional regulator [Candidatus Bathyarchaeota archaeon]|nr:MAG: transcriptional regulator [Candidatus Bathyarchaeota archaeon]RLI31228.1 MAG: transcriptional regulator [Candidatus Bathyarchaeota archaeon]
MSRRRNNLDIMAEILEIARLGAKKTWIVYKANLNFKIVKEYLSELMEKGLLERDGSLYYTTDRGLEFLEEYENFKKFRVVVTA